MSASLATHVTHSGLQHRAHPDRAARGSQEQGQAAAVFLQRHSDVRERAGSYCSGGRHQEAARRPKGHVRDRALLRGGFAGLHAEQFVSDSRVTTFLRISCICRRAFELIEASTVRARDAVAMRSGLRASCPLQQDHIILIVAISFPSAQRSSVFCLKVRLKSKVYDGGPCISASLRMHASAGLFPSAVEAAVPPEVEPIAPFSADDLTRDAGWTETGSGLLFRVDREGKGDPKKGIFDKVILVVRSSRRLLTHLLPRQVDHFQPFPFVSVQYTAYTPDGKPFAGTSLSRRPSYSYQVRGCLPSRSLPLASTVQCCTLTEVCRRPPRRACGRSSRTRTAR